MPEQRGISSRHKHGSPTMLKAIRAISELNESEKLDDKCTVGSANVKALYPSIDVDGESRGDVPDQ